MHLQYCSSASEQADGHSGFEKHFDIDLFEQTCRLLSNIFFNSFLQAIQLVG